MKPFQNRVERSGLSQRELTRKGLVTGSKGIQQGGGGILLAGSNGRRPREFAQQLQSFPARAPLGIVSRVRQQAELGGLTRANHDRRSQQPPHLPQRPATERRPLPSRVGLPRPFHQPAPLSRGPLPAFGEAPPHIPRRQPARIRFARRGHFSQQTTAIGCRNEHTQREQPHQDFVLLAQQQRAQLAKNRLLQGRTGPLITQKLGRGMHWVHREGPRR